MNHVVRIAFSALMVSACSSFVAETPTPTAGTSPPTIVAAPSTSSTTIPLASSCVHVTSGAAPVATGSVAGDALTLSGELFLCAGDVVVVGEGDLNEVAAAAQLAAALEGPLLHPHPQLAAELGRLKPSRVYLLGDVDVITPPDADVIRPTIEEAVERARDALGVSEELRLPAQADASTVLETMAAMASRDKVVLPQTDANPTTGSLPVATVDPAALVTGLARPTNSLAVWLMDAAQPVAILSAAASGRVAGATVVAYDPGDILGFPEVGAALAGAPPGAIRYIGAVPEAHDWELAVLTSGLQVPGGGFHAFPEDQPRRYVAFYGHPETIGLGVLGEQGPQATLERMAPFLTEYAADGRVVIPTFEIIASVASGQPTEDGDYSFEWPISAFDEWIAVAREHDAQVVLDLQPGREDFLTQAKQYEELLLLPFVSLALDPEWRLTSDQVHLNQVGRVNASEVNTVVDWLADLVRDNGLPQKMLIVHQFKTTMITDRETLKQRPELQMVIQMDGQGPIPTKDETFLVLTRGTEDAHWVWGWKNFFDEDSPATATPAYTIDKDPVPVFVSYQ
jgi:hypothetical protein